MYKKSIVVIVFLILGACTSGSKNNQPSQNNPINNQSVTNMNSYVSIFEIPATNIQRAISFYEGIFSLKIEKMEMPGMQMGILPYEDQMVVGVIIQDEESQPSANGITVYLNGGNDLQVILDKVETNGGKVIMPKTPHADESGYFALFLDTEGNRLGLHSPN